MDMPTATRPRYSPEHILSPKEAAEYLGISLASLRRQSIPTVFLTARRRGYRFATLTRYVRDREE
jgi:hypothetical protein